MKKIFKVLLITLLLVMNSSFAASAFDDALKAYNSGNVDKAIKILRPVVLESGSHAQFTLGQMYDVGKKDYVNAFQWYKYAANAGYPEAQYNVAGMFESGQGVAQNFTEAFRWYKLAASEGHANAQYNLANLYSTGQGVAQDYVKAHMWWNLRAAEGDKEAKENRDKVAKKMTKQQLVQAEKLARECQATKYNDC
jgi:hypothetical protein